MKKGECYHFCNHFKLLNIIGGLDQYTEGDLIINGKSTKEFKDRDGDTYRNHSDMINALNSIEESENDLKSFRKHLIEQLANEESALAQAVNGVQYSYN